MALTIVLATEDADLREHVELVVEEANDLVLVAAVNDLDRLSEALTSADVDVLLLDERMPRLSLRETVRDASIIDPFAAVVLLTPATGEQPTAERYAAALEAGARSTLAVPTSLEELRTRVQQAAEWGRSLRSHVGGGATGRAATRGRLVAVAGAKGGVGTSVISCLLAREALSSTASVCLVDADLRGGTIGFYADVTARRDLADLAQVASDLTGRSIREVAVSHESGLVLVLAPEAVERGDELTGDVARAVFGHLRSHFDVVVVDCGADLDEARAMVLELADEVVLVTSTDVVALRAARAALATWERLAVRAPGTVRLVVNRASRKVEVQPDLVERVIGLPVATAFPAAFRALEAPLNSGRLLVDPPAVLLPAVHQLAAAVGLAAAAPTGRGRQPREPRPPRAPRERRASRAPQPQPVALQPQLVPVTPPPPAQVAPPAVPVPEQVAHRPFGAVREQVPPVPQAPSHLPPAHRQPAHQPVVHPTLQHPTLQHPTLQHPPLQLPPQLHPTPQLPLQPVAPSARDPWAAPSTHGYPAPPAQAPAPVYGHPAPAAPAAPPAPRAPRRQRVDDHAGLMARLSPPDGRAGAADDGSATGFDPADPMDRA